MRDILLVIAFCGLSANGCANSTRSPRAAPQTVASPSNAPLPPPPVATAPPIASAAAAPSPCIRREGGGGDVERGAQTTGAAAKLGGEVALEGAKTFGRSVRGWFKGGSKEAKEEWNRGA